jgi:hypothetical protein
VDADVVRKTLFVLSCRSPIDPTKGKLIEIAEDKAKHNSQRVQDDFKSKPNPWSRWVEDCLTESEAASFSQSTSEVPHGKYSRIFCETPK